jgi:hypothetical protein
MKICNICKTEKDLNKFANKQNSKDGKQNYCKSCQKESQKQYAEENLYQVCNTCNIDKPINDFPKLNTSLKGYGNKCKDCHKPRMYGYWTNTKERVNLYRKIENLTEEQIMLKRYQKREQAKNDPIGRMLMGASQRAKKRGLDFDITREDIVIPEKCPYLGILLYPGKKDDYKNSPSLDRIDSSKGYIKGNIQVISSKANTMKNDASIEELITFAKNILKNL